MTDPANPITSRLVGVPRNPSLRRFLDFWLAHIAWAQLRYATARTYASVVAHHIGPVLGRVKVADLTATHLEQAKVVWTRAGVTDSMRRKAIVDERVNAPEFEDVLVFVEREDRRRPSSKIAAAS